MHTHKYKGVYKGGGGGGWGFTHTNLVEDVNVPREKGLLP